MISTLVRCLVPTVLFAASLAGTAQTFPAKAVKIISPWAAGGGSDALGRLLGNKLSEKWGQPVVIENRPGASGNIGAAMVARAPPDGYTIMLTADVLFTMASLYKSLPFDPKRDFTPITLLVGYPYVLVVNSNSTMRSVADVIATAKANLGRLNYASAGVGTPFQLAAELFMDATQIKMTPIPYKGGGPAVTDLIAGHVDLAFANYGNVQPMIKAGRLRALGITTVTRSSAAPDLPTVAESGVPGYSFGAYFGFFAPARISRPILEKLHSDITNALKASEIRDLLSSQGADLIASGPEEFSAFLQSETEKWTRVIKAAGISLD